MKRKVFSWEELKKSDPTWEKVDLSRDPFTGFPSEAVLEPYSDRGIPLTLTMPEVTSIQITEFFYVFIFLLFAIFLAVIILGLSYILAVQKPDTEKGSAYECGFDPYDDARNAFDVRFYLVAILFIIFDLEAMFFFPWAISLSFIGSEGIWCMMDFIIELFIGYFYAWRLGVLDWE